MTDTVVHTATSNHVEGSYADVLGVKVSALNMDQAIRQTDAWIASGQCGFICVTGVHGVMEAQRDLEFLRILNSAMLNAPDGMPMSWVGHLQGFTEMDRVYGPDFMAELCRLSVPRGYRHFLYGGDEGVAELLRKSLESKFPGIEVVGTFTPPFRDLTREEEAQLCAQIESTKPHIMWIGLSTPKQERFMARYVERLGVPLLVGVGAAFDYHTGRLRDCPRWIKRAGLQWLHRLFQDPRRLWKRYARNNPEFLWKMTLQLLHLRSSFAVPREPVVAVDASASAEGLSK
ncbi:WecB/TagA/CpsF family glycosyltransferase [Granulicella sp. 5B5]|uniref:WecB/TagA/CpsF family glycosyltransferase n=1 Tax=Granulicella sp. 5B5 TaxID=1617967 RepID=UPI0015F4C34E|nr:WecB/TagA/CpsF family glycosyltransferase [Granulicella sp. 5B5]QMV20016.1 WecB/TagA/CpsF family glycosyltransferase [Granulicella sp. 5B5]